MPLLPYHDKPQTVGQHKAFHFKLHLSRYFITVTEKLNMPHISCFSDTGIKSHINKQLIKERVYLGLQIQRGKHSSWQEGMATEPETWEIIFSTHKAENKMEVGWGYEPSKPAFTSFSNPYPPPKQSYLIGTKYSHTGDCTGQVLIQTVARPVDMWHQPTCQHGFIAWYQQKSHSVLGMYFPSGHI